MTDATKTPSIFDLLARLERAKIYFELGRYSSDSMSVNIVVPGQRWEVQFFEEGRIEVEKFFSDGTIYDAEQIKQLFMEFTDK